MNYPEEGMAAEAAGDITLAVRKQRVGQKKATYNL